MLAAVEVQRAHRALLMVLVVLVVAARVLLPTAQMALLGLQTLAAAGAVVIQQEHQVLVVLA